MRPQELSDRETTSFDTRQELVEDCRGHDSLSGETRAACQRLECIARLPRHGQGKACAREILR